MSQLKTTGKYICFSYFKRIMITIRTILENRKIEDVKHFKLLTSIPLAKNFHIVMPMLIVELNGSGLVSGGSNIGQLLKLHISDNNKDCYLYLSDEDIESLQHLFKTYILSG